MTDKWQQELPKTEGDWLWVNMWGCACCVQKSGIAYVHEVYPDVLESYPLPIHYKVGDKWLGISWEGQKPFFKDKEEK